MNIVKRKIKNLLNSVLQADEDTNVPISDKYKSIQPSSITENASMQLDVRVNWIAKKVSVQILEETQIPLIKWKIIFNRYNSAGGYNNMAITITDTQKVSLSIQPVDARGNPAEVQDVSWTTSDASIATVEQDTINPLQATVSAVGPLGNVQIAAAADADVGEGVTTLTGLLDVSVVAGEAVSLDIQTSAPTEQ